MKLPDIEHLRIDRDKLAGYLLSPANPRGRSKANFFLRFGFSTDSWDRLAKALETHAASHEVTRVVETSYGPRYYVERPIETPDGRNPVIRTAWQVDQGTTHPRLITAHPLRRCQMFKEHEQIVLTAGVIGDEGEDLRPGDVGTVVHLHPGGEAFVVEFTSLSGDTVAMATVLPWQARSVKGSDLTHARTIPASADL